jgi:hypothetical protein
MASGKSTNESSVRSRAKRVGYVVHKSRQDAGRLDLFTNDPGKE